MYQSACYLENQQYTLNSFASFGFSLSPNPCYSAFNWLYKFFLPCTVPSRRRRKWERPPFRRPRWHSGWGRQSRGRQGPMWRHRWAPTRRLEEKEKPKRSARYFIKEQFGKPFIKCINLRLSESFVGNRYCCHAFHSFLPHFSTRLFCIFLGFPPQRH